MSEKLPVELVEDMSSEDIETVKFIRKIMWVVKIILFPFFLPYYAIKIGYYAFNYCYTFVIFALFGKSADGGRYISGKRYFLFQVLLFAAMFLFFVDVDDL